VKHVLDGLAAAGEFSCRGYNTALVRVLAIFADDRERWGTVGVAADILQGSVECIIDGLEWKLRGEHKH
jgi:hypothetical protein